MTVPRSNACPDTLKRFGDSAVKTIKIMDITIIADQVEITATHGSYSKTVEVQLTGADEDFIKEISKECSINDLLAGKTEAEIRTWVVNEYDWVQNLLNAFWQRSSDACPLEASEAEAQELAFIKFVNEL